MIRWRRKNLWAFDRSRQRSFSRWYSVVFRWTARLTGLAFVGLIVSLWIGEGSPNLAKDTPTQLLQYLLFVTIPLGFLLAWKWEGLGGIISLMALVGIYVGEFLTRGRFPGGWVFPTLAVPAILFVICYLLEQAQPSADGESTGPT